MHLYSPVYTARVLLEIPLSIRDTGGVGCFYCAMRRVFHCAVNSLTHFSGSCRPGLRKKGRGEGVRCCRCHVGPERRRHRLLPSNGMDIVPTRAYGQWERERIGRERRRDNGTRCGDGSRATAESLPELASLAVLSTEAHHG